MWVSQCGICKRPRTAQSLTLSLPPRLDFGHPPFILLVEMATALEHLQRVFLVGQAEAFGALEPHQRHVAAGRLSGLAMRRPPRNEDIGVALAPWRPLVVVERRT